MFDINELEKEYAFDMEGFGTEKREGNPRLVKIGSSDYNYANDNNWVVSISKAAELLKNTNIGIFTIRKDLNSKFVQKYLVSKGISEDRIMDY